LLNGLRVVSYLPQIIRIHRDLNGAVAVSILTWSLFAAANIATVCYVLTTSGDRLVATMFALNTIGCLVIAVLTAFKRWSVAPRRTGLWSFVTAFQPPPARPSANISEAARVCTPAPGQSKG
jgi:uncharacterized membrane protein (DUF4010 family)